MTQYAFSFWCCSTIGPEGQNCFGQAGVALMCRRRPSHAFFGFDKALKPALDTDTQGRLITLVFLDYVIFHLYVPAKPSQMLEFYKKLTTHVENTMETFKLPCIMMGDLNCPFTEEDISDSRPWIQPGVRVDYEPCRHILQELMARMDVVDCRLCTFLSRVESQLCCKSLGKFPVKAR